MTADTHVHFSDYFHPFACRPAEPARLHMRLGPGAVNLRGIEVEAAFDNERTVLDGAGARMHWIFSAWARPHESSVCPANRQVARGQRQGQSTWNNFSR